VARSLSAIADTAQVTALLRSSIVSIQVVIVETRGRGLAMIGETQPLLSRHLQPYFEKRVRQTAKRR